MTSHYYRVDEFITTFGKDPGQNNSFSHSETFNGNDLLNVRNKAADYYNKRLGGPESGSYFLPLSAPADFKPGSNAAFSINLILVEVSTDGEEYEYVIAGESDDEVNRAREIEKAVFLEHGVILNDNNAIQLI